MLSCWEERGRRSAAWRPSALRLDARRLGAASLGTRGANERTNTGAFTAASIKTLITV